MRIFRYPLMVKSSGLNMLEAGDLYQMLKDRAEEKAIKVVQVDQDAILRPRSDKWLSKAAMFFILALGVMVLIGVVRGVFLR